MSRPADPPLTRRHRRELERLERAPRQRSRTAARRSTPSWRSPFVLLSLSAVAAVALFIFATRRPTPAAGGDELVAPPIAYGSSIVDGATLGAASAPVTLEVWSDFQCPVCARFVREQLGTLKTQLVDPGTLRIVQHDIDILGTGARDESLELGAGAACAAEQGRYWPFHDLVFWNQGRENRGDHDEAFLASVADRAGLDRGAWDACMGGDTARDGILSTTATAARAGIRSTPTLSLNGGPAVAGLPRADALIAQIRALATASGGASPVTTP